MKLLGPPRFYWPSNLVRFHYRERSECLIMWDNLYILPYPYLLLCFSVFCTHIFVLLCIPTIPKTSIKIYYLTTIKKKIHEAKQIKKTKMLTTSVFLQTTPSKIINCQNAQTSVKNYYLTTIKKKNTWSKTNKRNKNTNNFRFSPSQLR